VKRKNIALLVLALVFLAGGWLIFNSTCKDAGKFQPTTTQQRMSDHGNLQAIDSGIHMLKTGDIVVRTGNDITSYMLCKVNWRDKTYSHCGLVVVENGYPFVYHSIGGEDNPDELLRRDSASFWFSPEHNLGYGIVRLDIPEEQQEPLIKQIRQFYTERKKFDMDFDLATDDRFYCAEFVSKTIALATGDSNYFTPTSILGYRYMGIDDLFLSKHANIICQIRYK
jgi:hypothetical protein